MNVFKLFRQKSRFFYFFLIVLSLISSLTSIGILFIINMSITGQQITIFGKNTYLAFIALIVISFLARIFFQNYMVRMSNDVLCDLELSIIQKVRNASYESFQKLGSEKVYAAIGDTRALSHIPEVFITLINSFITIICSLLYFFWVSPVGCITVLALMSILFLFYWYQNTFALKDFNKLRDLQDFYYFFLRELVDGFKQLQISANRNDNLYKRYILANRLKSKTLGVSTAKRYIITELIGVYSWYAVFGFVIFVLPVILHVNVLQLAAFITTVLFMMGPVSQIVNSIPFYVSCKISIERISMTNNVLEMDAQASGKMAPLSGNFKSIRFENLSYKYDAGDGMLFEFSLTELEIKAQEIVFIVGGNGSGKTTFINLITGLYKPTGGRIFINDKEIGWDEFRSLSGSMAVVYSNQHLFRENHDEHDLSEGNFQLKQLIQMVNLKDILKIDHHNNRFVTQLSKGQEKRLALLLALLEDKPIIVFDEWAAEQDTFNRRSFYTEWLETLKGMGKTIISVTHDDEYYHVADRVVKFSQGKIISDTRPVGPVSEIV